MIKIIPINEPHILAFEISGTLNEQDYEWFTPQIDRLIEKEKRISVLIKLNDFEGWTAKAAWEDLKIGYNHNDDFLRIAIVGNSFKDKMMAKVGDLFMDAQVEYFEDESKGMNWLKEVQNLAEKDEYIGYRHVLVASDFSEYATEALKKAWELAKPFNAKVTLIHAADMSSTEVYPTLGEMAVPIFVDNPDLVEKLLSKMKKKLLEQVTTLDLPEDEISIVALSGHPVDIVVEFARKENVDLIVMGSHGRRGLARLVGSSTNGVINHAACDVLTVI